MKHPSAGSGRRLIAPPAAVSRRRFLEVAGKAGTASAAFLVASAAWRAQAAGEPLKIGSKGPFTGPASRTGDEIKNGVAMALEDARAAGDLPLVIDGEQRDVEIVYIDSQSSPEKAVKAVTDAITREGVKFIANGWHSSVAMALLDAEAPYKIVHLGHLGELQFISEKINQDPQKYRGWFKGWPAPPVFAGLYGPPLKHFIDAGLWRPANMKAAVLVEDTDFGRGWGEAAIESLSKVGFEVLPYDVTALEETEFSPLLTKYKAQQVALVGMTSTGNVSVSNFVKQFRQQDVKALMIAHGLGWFSEWYELTGDASDYAVAIDLPAGHRRRAGEVGRALQGEVRDRSGHRGERHHLRLHAPGVQGPEQGRHPRLRHAGRDRLRQPVPRACGTTTSSRASPDRTRWRRARS